MYRSHDTRDAQIFRGLIVVNETPRFWGVTEKDLYFFVEKSAFSKDEGGEVESRRV